MDGTIRTPFGSTAWETAIRIDTAHDGHGDGEDPDALFSGQRSTGSQSAREVVAASVSGGDE